MYKTNRLRLTIAGITTTLALSACGGGGSNDFSPAANVKEQIAGDWITGCITYTDGTSEIRTVTFKKRSDGNDGIIIGKASYNDDNCSENSEVLVFGGSVLYKGTASTPSCTAVKIDSTIDIVDNGDILTGNDARQYLSVNGLPEKDFNLACKVGSNLFLGDDSGVYDASTEATRPTRMNTQIPYSVWDRSGRQAKNSNTAIQDKLSQIQQHLKTLK